MTYKVEYTKQTIKQLKKLDAFTRVTILQWIDRHLSHTDNPQVYGKGLTSNHTGEWRYRVGDYRILAKIEDSEIAIVIFTIQHRSNVYK